MRKKDQLRTPSTVLHTEKRASEKARFGRTLHLPTTSPSLHSRSAHASSRQSIQQPD